MAETLNLKFVIETEAKAPIPRDDGMLESYSPEQIMFRVDKVVNRGNFKQYWEEAVGTLEGIPLENDPREKWTEWFKEYPDDILAPLNLEATIIEIPFENTSNIKKPEKKIEDPQDYRFLYRYMKKSPFSLVFVRLKKGFVRYVEDVLRKDPVTYYVEKFNDNKFLPRDVGELKISYAMPIWRARGTPDEQHVGGGGPGSLPFPISEEVYVEETKKFRQESPDPRPIGRKVRVYVLDTLYLKDWDKKVGGSTADKSLRHSRENAHPAKLNDATRRWWNRMIMEERYVRADEIYALSLGLTPEEISVLYGEFEKFRQYRDIPTYVLYDHGPFITDIIYRKAPNVEIVLVETLNGNATGDLITYAAVMSWLRHDINKVLQEEKDEAAQAQRTMEEYLFLVNCSFTFPLNAQVYGRDGHITESVQSTEALMRFGALLVEMSPLLVEIKSLPQVDPLDHVLVISAAGNDSLPWGEHSMPALPAVLPGVLGVGALSDQEDDLRASYSNESDNDCEIKIITDDQGDTSGTRASSENTIKLGEFVLDREAWTIDHPDLHIPDDTDAGTEGVEAKNILNILPIQIKELELFAFGGELEMEPLAGRTLKVRGGVVGPYLAVPPYASLATGYAQWTGTSFATAYITANIAERLLQPNKDKRGFRYPTPYAAAQSIAGISDFIDGVIGQPSPSTSVDKGFLVPSGG